MQRPILDGDSNEDIIRGYAIDYEDEDSEDICDCGHVRRRHYWGGLDGSDTSCYAHMIPLDSNDDECSCESFTCPES